MAQKTSINIKPCNIGSSEAHNKRTAEYLAIHLVHKLSADVKPKSASLQVFCVCTSPKAFKDVRQIRIGKRTAAILHSNKNTALLFGKAD